MNTILENASWSGPGYNMCIPGISAYYHDSAAALAHDGRIIFAAEEERYARKKHDPGFPGNTIHHCLCHAGMGLADVGHTLP